MEQQHQQHTITTMYKAMTYEPPEHEVTGCLLWLGPGSSWAYIVPVEELRHILARVAGTNNPMINVPMIRVRESTIQLISYRPPSVKKEDILIKYIEPGIEPISMDNHGTWIDLRAAQDVNIKALTYAAIPLGVSMKIPDGYEVLLAPKSSVFYSYGLLQTNGIGIIDENCCDNDKMWKMPVYATRDVLIHKNTQICKFRLIKQQPDFHFIQIEQPATSPDDFNVS